MGEEVPEEEHRRRQNMTIAAVARGLGKIGKRNIEKPCKHRRNVMNREYD